MTRYIHFSTRPEPPQVPPRAMNLFSGGSGPRGVYTYQDDVAPTYGGDRSYRFVLEPTVPVVSTRTYSKADLERDLAALSARYDISKNLRMWDKYHQDFRAHTLPFAKLWYVIRTMTDRPETEDYSPNWFAEGCINPRFARQLLVELGHEVIDDRVGIIYASEPQQAVFLTDTSFRVVKDNPARGKAMRSRSFVQNPAWVTSHLAASWVTISNLVPAQWMPKLDQTEARGGKLLAKIPEYGCGAYGCVMPTNDPAIVLKLTSDETEAQFAAKLAKTLPVPICTIYRTVIDLPTAKRQGRKVYLLWREAADDVGKVDTVVGHAAELAVDKQHKAAQAAFEVMQAGGNVTETVNAWKSATRELAKIPELRWLAEGMIEVYDKTGIFFGDVHGGNLGRARGQWVITDPGHVAVVKKTN